KVGRNHTRRGKAQRRTSVEINEGGRGIADQHFGPVESEDAKAIESDAKGKLAVRKVVTVRPGADLTVIGKFIPWRDEIIGPIGAGRIACLRNGDRLVVWRCGRAGESKLREDPAIRHSIVENEPVAIVVTRSNTTERREKRAQLKRRTAWHTVFIKDPNSAAVHNLYVV